MTANASAVAQAADSPAIPSLARTPRSRAGASGIRAGPTVWKGGLDALSCDSRDIGRPIPPQYSPDFCRHNQRDETWFLEFAMDSPGGGWGLPSCHARHHPSDGGCDSAILD